MSASNDITYRVTVHPTTNEVEIMAFELLGVDTSALGLYDSIKQAPLWVQERVATLMMIDPTPPIEPVEGVGRRIDASTYWVHP